jgi:pyridoxal phosphate enzyme (YggS family)
MLTDRDIRQLHENLARVRDRIGTAATAAGRSADDVRLVGVTKYVVPDLARELLKAGLCDLGESRPQELWRKTESIVDSTVRWHMIGHMQRNKIRRSLPFLSTLHSGDSLRMLQSLNDDCTAIGKTLPLLIEVNVSGDASKQGFQPGEVAEALPQIANLSQLQVVGLMSMASLEGGSERARRDFAALRELRDQLQAGAPHGITLQELSMGMSDDFEEAIAEGSTMVRVGSALFEGIEVADA